MKLTARQVVAIRVALALGTKQDYLAAVYGVTQATISNVNRERGAYVNATGIKAGRIQYEYVSMADSDTGPVSKAVQCTRTRRSAARPAVDSDGTRCEGDRYPFGRAPGFSGSDTRRHVVRIDRR